jgi:hypothetical protein
MIKRTNQARRAKIDDPGGTKASETKLTRGVIVTERKPPCDVCGSMQHGLRVTRAGVGDNYGVNFFCPVATREEMRSDQLEPCPEQIAKYYQYDETCLSLVFKDIREKGYGRFVTSDTIDRIENRTREICQESCSDTSPPKRRKIAVEEVDSRPMVSSEKVTLSMGEKVSRG